METSPVDPDLDHGRSGLRLPGVISPAPNAWYRRRELVQPLRYLAVGAFCAGLNNAILITSAALGLNFAVSVACSSAILIVVGYLAHCLATFKTSPSRKGFGRYAAAAMVNLMLFFVILSGFEALHLPMIIAAPATTAMTFIINYASSQWAIVGRR